MILNAHEKMIAKRYLVPVKGERFIFVVAGFSIGAVALGVAALIIVMSVMNGFRAELFDKIVGLNGHAIVQGYDGRLANWEEIADAARKTPGVQSATPLIEQPLMASANGRVEGVLVRGNTLKDIRTNPILNGKVVSGDLKSITPGSGRVAIGARLGGNARRLSRIRDFADQPGRPLDAGRHGTEDRHLHGWRDLRGWHLRI
jgi:lipoprotein-releasing system permease protein